MDRVVILGGSSRKDGNTAIINNYLASKMDVEIIDLIDYKISAYDYLFLNKEDDFIQLINNILDDYSVIIFSTPVYWYSMSGIMKNFIDRFTDLLKQEKEIGRKFRGKSMFVLSNSESNDQESYFWKPFENTADYLGMYYIGHLHAYLENGEINNHSLTELNSSILRLKEYINRSS